MATRSVAGLIRGKPVIEECATPITIVSMAATQLRQQLPSNPKGCRAHTGKTRD